MSMINHVRLYKKVYLVRKLLGLKGETPTRCFCNKEDMSNFKWSFGFVIVDKPKIKVY